MHGGSVEARSAGDGQGSEFVVRLPIALEPRGRAARPPAAAPRHPRQRRILVVDDNRDAAASLAMLLELDGHEIVTAHDGAAALEAAEAHRPDVVLLDIGLPRARRLRGVPAHPAAAVGQRHGARRAHRVGPGGGPRSNPRGRLRRATS